jgi:S-(hydroxymethyl)glutathione dehydrogenase/alcohol dehydrogenase
VPTQSISRRALIRKTAGIAGAVASAPVFGQGPAVVTGRRFRAWIGRGLGRGRTTLQEVTLRPISGRQVVVRTEATNLCYSNAGAVLGLTPPAAITGTNAGGRNLADLAVIQGHGGVGVVEAVGPEVRRVRVGDRVCVAGTPQCGNCYQCLRGRGDVCQFLSRIGPADLVAIGDLRDGTPVYENSHIGGLAELMVTWEEWVVPVFSRASAADLGMACACVAVAGLGATVSGTLAKIPPAATVAVVGCGPLGLSAVQGARIAGASRIIAIDPVKVRRDVALKVGATHVLDPNVETGDRVIDRVREISMADGPGDRYWSGGRDTGGRRSGSGADFVVEAAGAATVTPRVEAGPDPTGVLPMQQAYRMCATGGDVVTTGLPRGDVTLPGVLFAIGGVSHHGGQYGGANAMRDIPRFVELMEKKQFDVKSLATTVVPIERMLDAYDEVVYRTTITAIMTV